MLQIVYKKDITWPRGKPKTLTPSPRTPDTDRVHGLPTDRSTVYPYGPPTDQPQNRIKNKNEDITYCFSNRSLVSAKFRALRWEKCNRPGFSIGRKFILVYCHFLCCDYKCAWKTGKTLGSLEICAALTVFHPPFCSAYSPVGSSTRPRLHNLLSGNSITSLIKQV